MSAYLSVICSCWPKARNGNVMMSSQSFVSLQSHQRLHSLPNTGSLLPTAWGESAFANFFCCFTEDPAPERHSLCRSISSQCPLSGHCQQCQPAVPLRQCALAAATPSIVYPGIFHIAPVPLCSYALSSPTQMDTFACLLDAQLPCNYTVTN